MNENQKNTERKETHELNMSVENSLKEPPDNAVANEMNDIDFVSEFENENKSQEGQNTCVEGIDEVIKLLLEKFEINNTSEKERVECIKKILGNEKNINSLIKADNDNGNKKIQAVIKPFCDFCIKMDEICTTAKIMVPPLIQRYEDLKKKCRNRWMQRELNLKKGKMLTRS